MNIQKCLTFCPQLVLIFALCLVLSACKDDAAGGDQQQAGVIQPQAAADPLQGLMDTIETQSVTPAEPARLAASPNALVFTGLNIGDDLTLPLTLSNQGGAPLAITGVQFTNNQDNFSIAGDCAAGTVLTDTSATCSVDITFRPSQAGNTNSSLMVLHNGANSPLLVSLTGQGATPQNVPSFNPAALPTPEYAYARKVMLQRRQGRLQVSGSNLPSSLSDLAQDEYKITDEDYSDLGATPTVSTFPVNRERMITGDRYIPALLESTINSQLPEGRAVAVIETHVYSAEGRNIIIPAGSRAIGVYKSLERKGQTRLEVMWNRIIRPDGVGIAVKSPGADQMGRTGLPGDVDNRYFDRYGVPLLMSTLAIVANYAASPAEVTSSTFNTLSGGVLGSVTNSSNSRENVAVRSFGGELLNTANQIMRENVQIEPITTIPAGTRFYIIPSQDIVLKKPTLMTAAMLDENSATAQVQKLFKAIKAGDTNLAAGQLVEVLGSAAKIGMNAENVSGAAGGFAPSNMAPIIQGGMSKYGPPPGEGQ